MRSASNKIDKLAACCKFRSFEYRERCIDGLTETWPQQKNDDSTVINLVGVGWTGSVPDAEGRLPGY